MVNKIRNGQGLIHYHTSGTTSGDIKKPTANQLYIGEIAINNNIEQPSLFIKNSSGTVSQFVDKEYIDNALAGKVDKPEPNYLCFTAEADNIQIGMKSEEGYQAVSVTIQYSTDKENWTDFTPDTTDRYFCTLNTGDKVYLKGNVDAFGNFFDFAYNCFISTGNFAASGNIDSLRNFSTTLTDSCYYGLFSYCTGLTSASELELPAITLSENCYDSMFVGCTSLTTAPELPATTLARKCYFDMFMDCTSLTTAPELPATTLVDECYGSMFFGCTSLTKAPSILPAPILVFNCYDSMFQGCTSLTTAPKIHATTFTQSCCQGMFWSCTSLTYIECLATNIASNNDRSNWVRSVAATGTFVKNPNTSNWPRGNNGIPNGWVVEDYVEIVPNSLNSLVDVSTANPTSGQSLVYNGTNWVNQNVSGGGDELTSNKVTSISSASTDTQYPSAKCVYDLLGPIDTALNTILNGQSN